MRDRGEHLAARSAPASAISPRPSTGIWCALATRPRIVVVRPPLIGPENAASISVPPPITNQVETSWLLATSPRLQRLVEPFLRWVF